VERLFDDTGDAHAAASAYAACGLAILSATIEVAEPNDVKTKMAKEDPL
jgi:hypothetical protein